MCTLTFMPRKNGYCLAMNRDEKLTRRQGLPPMLKVVNGRRVICPSEPGGGTWIALNDSGVSLALINWYSVATRVQIAPISRGEVVNAACSAENPRQLKVLLSTLPLGLINPFRLIGVFPAFGQITEYRWDLKKLDLDKCTWQPQQWISSGFDELKAQRERSRTFQQALEQKSAGSLSWLRRLHRSHAPGRGPFSTCMHRQDAGTVSYTEALFSPSEASVWHCLGSPCQPEKRFTGCLKRDQ
jgi:hypothetical protein